MAMAIMIGDSTRSMAAPTSLSNTHFRTRSQSAIGLSKRSSSGTVPIYE